MLQLSIVAILKRLLGFAKNRSIIEVKAIKMKSIDLLAENIVYVFLDCLTK
jgi:hypothetical protein